jgi:hypothetical protein
MKSGYDFTTAGSSEPALVDQGPGGPYVPSLADELGERVLILDDEGTPSLELLRFRSTLTTIPGFEVALRRRVERLRQFRHEAFGPPPAVEYLGADRRLVLLSSYIKGRRLADVIEDAQGPAFASSLIQQLAPALAAFHHYGDGIGHGALTPARIVITPEGKLIIVEHVLGSALERLQLAAGPVHLDLGIPVPATAITFRPRIDNRTDFFQLGLVALSLLLGRRLSPEEASGNLGALLNEVLPASLAPEIRGLRRWLERALQLNGKEFSSSGEATDALREIADEGPDGHAQRWLELLRETPFLDEITPASTTPDAQPDDAAPLVASELVDEFLQDIPPDAPVPVPPATPAIAVQSTDEPKEQAMEPKAVWAHQPQVPLSSVPARSPRLFALKPPKGYLQWLVVALALCAIVEAVAIGFLLRGRWNAPPPVNATEVKLETPDPGAAVMVNGQSAGVTPLQLKIGPEVQSISVVSASPAAPTPDQTVGSTGQQNPAAVGARAPALAANPAPTAPVVPPAQRTGGIRLTSPIEVEVFEGDKRLGSSATGIVSASVGRHELDLVNSVLGFRTRQVVDIKDGRVVPVVVTPPNGRININAVPWAEVLIDGKSVGDTPIGNLSIPLGEHDIVFRHPQLGELRRIVVVRSDVVARVSVSLEK